MFLNNTTSIFNLMTLIQESHIQVLLSQCEELSTQQERQARESLIAKIDKIHQFFKSDIRSTYAQLSSDVIIKFCQIAVEIKEQFKNAKEIVQLFFERIKTSNQFYIRALFVKAKVAAYQAHLDSLKGDEMLLCLKQSISYITKALDLISPQQEVAAKGKDPKGAQSTDNSLKSKYSFLIYNASTTLFKVTRFMLRPGWQKHFADIYQRIYKNLEELDQPDHNWKCRFCMTLYQCMYDADKKADAFKILDTLWEKTKTKPCEFQDSLFRLRVFLTKENNALAAVIKKDTEGADPNAWRILEVLQRMRSGLIPQPQIQKQLMGVVNQISVNVLSNAQSNAPPQLSSIMQDRLAEAGRVALRFNLINLANSIIQFLGKTRQPSQRALILNEYNKAQILIKRKGEYVDKKTGMTMSAQQIKEIQIQNRKQALKMLEKVMLINKKIDQADLIYEGAILIWNLSLPFLTEQYYTFCYKALDISLGLLDQVDSVDFELRTKMHLQLINIYFKNDLMFAQVKNNVYKALTLDPAVATSKLINKGQPQEDPSLYNRPYQRYLLDFKQKVMLKLNEVVQQNDLDYVTQHLWTLQGQKSQTTKIDTIQNCLKILLNWKESQFVLPSDLLVQQEIKQLKINYERQKLRNYKRSKLLAHQIAKISFEWELNDFCKKACELVLADNWDVKNAVQLIIAQGNCSLYMAQIKIDQLYQSNYQPLFQQQTQAYMPQNVKKEVKAKKDQVLHYLKKTLQYAINAQQSYLIFNGAICIWNNFLHIFKVNSNDPKIRPDFHNILRDYFEAMRNNLKESQSKGIISYDSDDKIQAFSNIGIVYSRLLQSQKQPALVEKVCEDLLLTNLSPNTRKIINGIKARVSGGKASIGGKPADNKKGAPIVQKIAGFNDNFILDINNQLELIRNCTNKTESETLVIKCAQSLQSWQPNDQDESELQLHAELWVKLARLGSNLENTKMLKLALRYSQNALNKCKNHQNGSIPSNRLRWYSLAYFISSQTMFKLVNPKTQQTSSVQGLLFLSLSRGCLAAEIGFKCCINLLVVDACKQVWNVCTQLQQSKSSRKKLLKPLNDLIGYFKELRQDSQPDLLLLMAQLYSRCAWENGMYPQGESVADIMLDLLPKTLHRPIWQSKMAFMSKQGKNQLQAISSIKEAEPSLQAKLWVKLARIAPNVAKQQSSYIKALQILKKEHSIEMVQVLIEYTEWQLRVGKQPLQAVIKNLQYANNMLVEIQPPGQMDQDQNNDDHMTMNSHNRSKSHRSKKSVGSKSMKSSQKQLRKDKKPLQSVKSKGSTVSRMNRSGQAAKSVKNKNTKSLFSVRQEQPNPDTLNCLHFQRLFRINTILASIHNKTQDKRIYAFNAYQHIISMLQKSIDTYNELQLNAAKVNEKDEKLNKNIESLPKSINEWVTYEFPAQYVEKIDKIQNFNFLGNFALQKPELTYAYTCKLVAIFQNMGLNYQAIPLLFMSRYLTKYIIKNENYYKLESLKLKRTLLIAKHPLQSAVKINPQDFKITDEELRQEIIKSEYQKSNVNIQHSDLQHYSAPNTIQPLSKYLCWLNAAQLLLDFGEVSLAKNLLRETLKCAKIVANTQIIGKVHMLLSRIGFLQGQNMQAIQQLSLAHRLCKSVTDWQTIVDLSSKVMLGVKKMDLLKVFLSKISYSTADLIEQSSKQGRQRSSFAIEVHQLKQLQLSVRIGLGELGFKNLIEQDSKQNRTYFQTSLAAIQKVIQQSPQILWNVSNHYKLIEVFQQIISFYQTKGNSKLFDLGYSNFQLCLNILQMLYRSSKHYLRIAGLSEAEGANHNLAFELQIKLALLLVNALLIDHSQSNRDSSFSESADKDYGNQQIQAYLALLNKDIVKKTQTFYSQPNQLEQCIAILNDLQVHIDQKSPLFAKLVSLQLFVNTLADHRSEESVDLAASFKAKFQQKLEGIDSVIESNIYQIKGFESITQQLLELNHLQGFESLAKFQHACSLQQTTRFLKKKLIPSHPCLAGMRLIQNAVCCNAKEAICKKQKLITSLTSFNNFEQSLKFVPKNSITIILQLNKSRTKIYYGMLMTETDPAQKRIVMNSKKIALTELKEYEKLQQKLLAFKKAVTKTPYDDPQRLIALHEQYQEELNKIKSSLGSYSIWWLKGLLQIMKTPKTNPNAVVDNTKKGAKEQKKKGGKDEIAGYQSSVPPAPCGVQSVTFLLDSFFYGLPFQELLPSDLISTVSKDHSFFWLTRKLQEIGFQSELNNSNGFGSQKGKYFAYDYKAAEKNFKTVVTEVAKIGDSLKWQGIESSTRLPSLGDYRQTISKNSFMQIYGSLDLVNHIKINSFLQNVGTNKLRLLVIHDNLNFVKSSLNKYKDLNTEGPAINLEQNEHCLAMIANLLNLTLVKNRWVGTPQQVISQTKQLYKGIANGIYIGAAVRQSRKDTQKTSFEWMCYLHGPAIVRL